MTPRQKTLERFYISKRDELTVKKLIEDLESKDIDEILETIKIRGF